MFLNSRREIVIHLKFKFIRAIYFSHNAENKKYKYICGFKNILKDMKHNTILLNITYVLCARATIKELCNNAVKISPLKICNFHIRNVTNMVLLTLHPTTLILKLQISFTANSYTVLTDVPIFIFSEF
jgi:hypothetical protein